MKKRLSTLVLVSALFLGNTTIQAQVGIKRAENNYEKLAYYDAIQVYEKVANRGFSSPELLKNIGNSYYFNGDYQQANKWFGQLFTEFPNHEIENEYLYRYAQTLKNIGDDKNATVYLNKFVAENSKSERAKLIQSDKNYKSEIEKNSGRFDIQDAKINSKYSDYGSTIYKNQVLFATSRDTGNFSKRVHTWTGNAFTDIYAADIQEDGTLAHPKKFSKKITTKFNESTPVITKDGKTMYFTRNNYNKGKRGINNNRTTLLKIYRAELVKDKWTNVTELPFNSNQFNTAHPVLDPTEKVMYFASDRPGGFGKSDIWKVAITDKGFGVPENLGAQINTDGRETFPFVSSDNELYFATDGRPGLGGLDVFISKIKNDESFTKPQNVGKPVNSSSDDFALIIDSQNKFGYFSSNRENGYGMDDIYAFKQNRALVLECIQDLKIKVIDAKTRAIISTANLDLFEMNYDAKATTNKMTTESKYVFATAHDCGMSYRVKVEAPGYNVKEDVVALPNESGVTEHLIVLEPKKVEIKKGDDLFKILDLNPIYFDLDKSNIRPDAAAELAKVLAVLEEYPTMKIDIRSHTDSRASHAYNDQLSDRRAKSTREWLISKGINPKRLTAKGYGERQLVNKCADGVSCTEEEHQANRRSEFIVVEL